MTSNPRVVVAQLLNDCLQQKTPLHYLMAQKKIENPTLPWPYIQALCFGVMRMYPRLYWLIHQYLAKPIKKKEALLEQLIIAGCYELLEMNTPDYAVIKETVFACDVLQKSWAKSLCNAVLRKVQEAIQTNTLCFDKDITAKTAHPKWLLGMLKKAWPSDWQTIVEANNIPPPLTIRINQKLITREKYQSILEEKNLSATPLSAPESLMVYPAVDITKLPYFDKGMVSIQDGAAQFSPHLLDLKPKLQVLDACAAPGGKTCHILECEPLLDTLIAIERYAHRAAFITENLARLRLKADIVIADATEPLPYPDNFFDRILLDTPCSATGIIRRQPDIKQLRNFEDLKPLVTTQRQLLDNLWPKLKPGGILLYATCSILPMENAQQIELFCTRHPNAQPLDFTLPHGHPQKLGWQILPGEGNMDGFYYAKLQKSKD